MSRDPLFDLQAQIQDDYRQLEASFSRIAEEMQQRFGGRLDIIRTEHGPFMYHPTTKTTAEEWYAVYCLLTPELDEIRKRQRQRQEQRRRVEKARYYLKVFCVRHLGRGVRRCHHII
jgi:hypothetical protein